MVGPLNGGGVLDLTKSNSVALGIKSLSRLVVRDLAEVVRVAPGEQAADFEFIQVLGSSKNVASLTCLNIANCCDTETT